MKRSADMLMNTAEHYVRQEGPAGGFWDFRGLQEE